MTDNYPQTPRSQVSSDLLLSPGDRSAYSYQAYPGDESVYPADVINNGMTECTLITFRRWLLSPSPQQQDEMLHTTIQIKKDDRNMIHVVKRLQKAKQHGLLTFVGKELNQLKGGEKRILFVLPQVDAKFAKEEFGEIKTDELLSMTNERPIIVEIQTELVPKGEQLDIF